MSDDTEVSVHWSFWVISGIALVWNVMGVMNYLMQTNPEAVAAMPETHRGIIEGRPAWATGGFAISVFGGAVGGILLLVRKAAATYLLIASLAGTVLTMIHTFSIAESLSMSLFETVLMMIMPLAVAVFLVWYARQSQSKGWIS